MNDFYSIEREINKKESKMSEVIKVILGISICVMLRVKEGKRGQIRICQNKKGVKKGVRREVRPSAGPNPGEVMADLPENSCWS